MMSIISRADRLASTARSIPRSTGGTGTKGIEYVIQSASGARSSSQPAGTLHSAAQPSACVVTEATLEIAPRPGAGKISEVGASPGKASWRS
jgi:hypothetical protein